MRTFESGAIRDADVHKLDYEGHLSPLVLRAYTQYLSKKRRLADGTLRDSDNWQLGFGFSSWMKSLYRHFMAAWSLHRGWPSDETLRDALCGILFNAGGYLHELVIQEECLNEKETQAAAEDKQEVVAETERSPAGQPASLRGEPGIEDGTYVYQLDFVRPCEWSASVRPGLYARCVLTHGHKGPCCAPR